VNSRKSATAALLDFVTLVEVVAAEEGDVAGFIVVTVSYVGRVSLNIE